MRTTVQAQLGLLVLSATKFKTLFSSYNYFSARPPKENADLKAKMMDSSESEHDHNHHKHTVQATSNGQRSSQRTRKAPAHRERCSSRSPHPVRKLLTHTWNICTANYLYKTGSLNASIKSARLESGLHLNNKNPLKQKENKDLLPSH
ncbi:Hypothetical predicted protein [Marmota monax]|uniref:Uncharacterized protein n=1 Tax=Marmota monax TaxID=9995 RepID=A0A5E4BQA6_MARMO|nr:hypothetical protein GHT09_010567 [Marmota monax]VTJ71834.1 Hypothetical predicted protein [Marmota monax]